MLFISNIFTSLLFYFVSSHAGLGTSLILFTRRLKSTVNKVLSLQDYLITLLTAGEA